MTFFEENRHQAVIHFRRARSQAHLQDILARLSGHPNDLIAFEDARRSLRGHLGGERELREIPLDAIVGSVGRYTDFTRQFLPRRRGDESRWARVMAAMDDPRGTPPIRVYQIGEAYFVLDGNHRVSVARQRNASHIHAYVTRVETRVPLSAGATPDDLIRLAEAAEFFEQTDLDRSRPAGDLRVTNPGQYRAILADIEDHLQVLAADGHDLGLPEAAAQWYDYVYLPIVELIRERGLLHNFPGRTETDLYIWVSRHRARLEAALGWAFDPEAAADDLAADPGHFDPAGAEAIGLAARPLRNPLAPEPPAGHWRRERRVESRRGRLSADLLVPLSGEPESWCALDQALIVAAREGGHLHGLHVHPSVSPNDSSQARAMLEEFDRRCAEAGVAGSLAFEVGAVTPAIVARARWSDLVVVNLAHPPKASGLSRLRPGFHALVQHCPRPVMAVPGPAIPLRSALLSYDGSPKATEALFAAAYLALQWGIGLTVLTVPEPVRAGEQALARARRYLEAHGVAADYAAEPGEPAAVIVAAARERACDLILIGGYGHSPLVEAVLGGTVDRVLRAADRPVLICR